LLARHKERLPRPERQQRFGAAAEARLNATDCSLSPSAGGIIRYWSKPIEGEIRDDQGICMVNPDTGQFMRYTVAGAYDSNIALLLTKGEDRLASYEHLSKVLSSTVLRGTDLATNLQFHYGLVNWFLSQNVMAKPTTRFVVPYLTLMGKLKEESSKIDEVFAFFAMKKHYGKLYGDDPALDRKGTLLTRPMEILLNDPHLLSGWLSANRKNFKIVAGKLTWLRNPLVIVEETYEYLNMTWRKDAPAAEIIWAHDRDLLQNALAFYAELREKFGLEKAEFVKLSGILNKDKPQGGFDAETWASIQASHLGYEVGNELFGLLFLVAEKTGFYDFKVEDDLEVTIPDYLNDPDLQVAMRKILVPPPATKADEIVTPGGGMYYAQEAPGMPLFINEGDHFEKGQPLFILEVMKMFNKVPAPFSGTVDKIIIEGGDGVIVQKGQPIFKVTPDEKFVEVDPKEIERERRATTTEYLETVL
ncbi:MAG: biotin carboxylase, partial [Deltaproteobacteria bacterium]|nr:biotin carboxylase [Deltaproteobacteria bacterium]